ncbi:MAG: GGDEF domain-containing protein [Acidobacteriia bacterium]|nr:GGDEF domain-containing protein [Terriglobia bacterium]
MILGDIDHLKNVNDTLGHLFGDEALREIGRRLRAQLRVYDGVGRYGGEEFLLILPNCDLANAMQRANELREYIASTPVVYSGAQTIVTMSMGVAVSNVDKKKRSRRIAESGRLRALPSQGERPQPGRALHRCRQEGRGGARPQKLGLLCVLCGLRLPS